MKEIIKVVKHYGFKAMALETMAALGAIGLGYAVLLIICDIVKYGI